MSIFSEQLKNYIKKSGLTQSELAKIAGISDSYISKACKGIRLPAENVIIEILLALRLPTDIFNNLLNQYRIEFFCNKFKTDFYTLETIKNFCKNIGYMPTLPINFNIYNTIPNVNSLRNPNNINSFLKLIFEKEAEKENGSIKIIVQKEYDFLMKILPSICHNKTNLEVSHIICLSSFFYDTPPDYNNKYNIDFLIAITPMLISGCNYIPYYYYDDISSHISEKNFMPYIIITSEYVVLISYDIDSAIILHSKEFIKFYDMHFSMLKNNCRPMINKINSILELMNHHIFLENQSTKYIIYNLSYEPCIIHFIPYELAKKNVVLDDYNKNILLTNFKSRLNKVNFKKTISFFSEAGLHKFIDTGEIYELPYGSYVPLTIEERLIVLKNMLKAIEKNTYIPIILNKYEMFIAKNLEISAYDNEHISITYQNNENKSFFFSISEKSISYTFFNFLCFLKDSPWVFSFEETLKIIKKYINILIKKINVD
ncbi:MAG: helix-turn-helix domain-containing protein [Clostridium sp.]